jgi:MFS family permease
LLYMKNSKLAIINILTFLVFSNIAFFFMYPIYLSTVDVSKTAIGLIMGTFSIASLAVRPLVGKTIDRLGEKPVLVSGLLMIFCCSFLYHVIPGQLGAIYALRIIHGVGFSAFIAAAFSTIAKFTPHETRGRAFSHNGATMLAALGFVPLAGERLMDAFGHPAIFHGGAATTFLAFSILVFTRKWGKLSQGVEQSVSYLEIVQDRSFFFVFMAMILFVDVQATVLHYFPLYAKTVAMRGGLFLSLSLGLAVAIRLFGGALLDRYSKLVIIRICFVLFGSGILLIYKLDVPFFFVLSVVLYGSGLGYLFPALNALGAEQGSMAQKAGMMSMLTMAVDGGFILGSIFSGLLSDTIGLSNTFVFAGAVSLLGALVTSLAPIREQAEN